MKRLLFLLLSVPFIAFGQGSKTPQQPQGVWQYQWLYADSILAMPQGCGAPTITPLRSAIYRDTCSQVTYIFDKHTHLWYPLNDGTTGVFLPISDTASMLSPYLRAFLGVKYSDTASMLAPYAKLFQVITPSQLNTTLAGYALINGSNITPGSNWNINITGSATLSWAKYVLQLSTPVAPAGGSVVVFVDSVGALAYRKSNGSITEFSAPSVIDTVNTISALTAYTSFVPKLIYLTGAQGGNLFKYVTTSQVLDSGIVFPATGIGSGYWVRQYDNSKGVNPAWFGAIINSTSFNNGPIFNTIFYHRYPINLIGGTYHTKTTINTFNAPVLMTGIGSDSSIISVDTNLNGIVIPYGQNFPYLKGFTLISTAPDSTVIGISSNQPFCNYENLSIKHFNHIDLLITSTAGVADFGVIKNCFFTFAQTGYTQSGGPDINNFHVLASVAEDCEVGFRNNGSGSLIEECSCEACDTSFYDGGQGNTYIHPYIELPLYNPSPIMYINSSNGRILFAAQWGFIFPKFALISDESGWDIQGYNYYQNFTDYQNEGAGAIAQIQYNSAGSGWAFQSPAHTGAGPLSFNLTGTGSGSTFNLYTANFAALGANATTNGWYIINGKNFQADVSSTGSGGSYGFQGTAPIGSVGWTSGFGNPNSNSLPFAAGSIYSQADNTDGYPFWTKASTTSFNTGWQRVLTTGTGTYVNPVDTSLALYKLKLWPSTKPATSSDSIFVYETSDSSLRKLPSSFFVKKPTNGLYDSLGYMGIGAPLVKTTDIKMPNDSGYSLNLNNFIYKQPFYNFQDGVSMGINTAGGQLGASMNLVDSVPTVNLGTRVNTATFSTTKIGSPLVSTRLDIMQDSITVEGVYNNTLPNTPWLAFGRLYLRDSALGNSNSFAFLQTDAFGNFKNIQLDTTTLATRAMARKITDSAAFAYTNMQHAINGGSNISQSSLSSQPFYGSIFNDGLGDSAYIGIINSPYYSALAPGWISNGDLMIGTNPNGASGYFNTDLVSQNGANFQIGFQGDPVPCLRFSASLSTQVNGAIGVGHGTVITSGTHPSIGTITEVYIDPTSTISADTVTLTHPLTDGMQLRLHFGGTLTSGTVVTTLSFVAGTGVTGIRYNGLPSTASVGDSIDFIFRSTGSSSGYWYKQ